MSKGGLAPLHHPWMLRPQAANSGSRRFHGEPSQPVFELLSPQTRSRRSRHQSSTPWLHQRNVCGRWLL